MSKRGRVPKPTSVKLAEGTYQPCRDPQQRTVGEATVALPELPAGAPPCPADLSLEAQQIWIAVVPALQEIGTLATTDVGVLELYCSTMAWIKKLKQIAEAEPLIETKGGKKLNPAAAERRKLTVIAERLATDLGLHYAARARAGGGGVVGASAEEKKLAAETEAFLFENAPFTVVQGGKTG